MALDARQAGAARGRGGRRRRGVQRAVLLVLPAVSRAGNGPWTSPSPRSLPACSTCAGSRSPPGRWPPSRSAPWPACSSAGSSPRSSPPWPPTPGSPSRPGRTCASTTWRRWSPRTRTCPVPRGSSSQQWCTKGGQRGQPGSISSSRSPSSRRRQLAAGWAGSRGRPRRDAVPRPARLHAVDELPAGQPVLAVPVDRGRLAARAVGAAHRRDRLAGPPPRRLNTRTLSSDVDFDHLPTLHRPQTSDVGRLIGWITPGHAVPDRSSWSDLECEKRPLTGGLRVPPFTAKVSAQTPCRKLSGALHEGSGSRVSAETTIRSQTASCPAPLLPINETRDTLPGDARQVSCLPWRKPGRSMR